MQKVYCVFARMHGYLHGNSSAFKCPLKVSEPFALTTNMVCSCNSFCRSLQRIRGGVKIFLAEELQHPNPETPARQTVYAMASRRAQSWPVTGCWSPPRGNEASLVRGPFSRHMFPRTPTQWSSSESEDAPEIEREVPAAPEVLLEPPPSIPISSPFMWHTPVPTWTRPPVVQSHEPLSVPPLVPLKVATTASFPAIV